MYTGLLLLILVAMSVTAMTLLSWAVYRRRSLQLIDASVESIERVHFSVGAASARGSLFDGLIRWLSLAGYRGRSAPFYFLSSMAGSVALATAGVLMVRQSHIVELMSNSLSNVPGGVGDLAQAIVSMTNWILFACIALVPILVVRADRRKRVEQVEQDLPLFLELLATLAEAGLGFEMGLSRIRDSETSERPLRMEFRVYERDILAGVSRTQALRNLVRRMEMNSVTVFVSALIQAEQIGASLAETLRRQADDLRDRRKMRALLDSQALTVKLVFPLVICFLPGIFVSTLGPVLNQMIKVADSVLRNGR